MTYMRCRLLTKVTITIIIITVLIPLVTAESIPTDKTGTVSAVIDGSSFQLSSSETIKIAAIDTPNSGQPGYSESKNYLTTLIQGKLVYLDTGAATTTDQQGRLLCVVYLDYNSTNYENINMAMIQNGYAAPNSQNSSGFDIGTWTWFVSKQTPTPYPSATIAPQPSETPTPTPFSPPSPSINPSIPELSTNLTFLIIALTTLLVTTQLYKKEKK
jgi:endonuclease YncB( thermonuclease family)